MKRSDNDLAFLLCYENVAWYEDGKVKILDRRIYPIKTDYVVCQNHREVAQAIADMVTQSAGPYTAAAMGMALAAHEAKDLPEAVFREYLQKAAYTLSHARPTTIENMVAVTDHAIDIVNEQLVSGKNGLAIVEALFNDAVDQLNHKYDRIEKEGENLLRLIPKDGTVMTQCFAETIVGMLLRAAQKQNSNLKFFCPETRPYYQGARLTASVIADMGFEVTVITDNMPGFVLKEKNVDVFTSAADVISLDGYIVNKVGTFQIALAANYYGIPYYVTGSPNRGHATIDTVTIEERDPKLVLESMGQKHTLPGVKGYYPAFDITPPSLCDGVITDKGIFSPRDLHAYLLVRSEE